jgi:hypothetical protein
MALVTLQRWTGDGGDENVLSLANDGTNIYAGLHTNPAKVIKIDPSDMSALGSYTATGNRYTPGLAHDGTYLYALVQYPFA